MGLRMDIEKLMETENRYTENYFRSLLKKIQKRFLYQHGAPSSMTFVMQKKLFQIESYSDLLVSPLISFTTDVQISLSTVSSDM